MAGYLSNNALVTQLGNPDRHVIDMADTIYHIRPDKAPLAVITGRTSKKPAYNPEFKWLEEDEAPLISTFSSGAGSVNAGTSETWTVANGAYFRPNDIVRVSGTAESVLVTAVAGNNITVTRGVGASGTQTAPAASTYLIIAGNALAENSSAPSTRMVVEDTLSNYCQIFREPVAVSNSQKATKEYGGERLAHLRAMGALRLARQLEYSLLFGKKSKQSSGTASEIRTTDGLFSRVTTKVTSLGSTVTAAGIDQALESAFEFGSDTKLLFAGRRLLTLLSVVARNSLRTLDRGEDTFGLQLTEWQTSHGRVMIIPHYMLVNDYATYGLIIDPEAVAMRVLSGNGENRDVKLFTNIQSPDTDGEMDEYRCEIGWEIRQERRHSIIYAASNATAAKDTGF